MPGRARRKSTNQARREHRFVQEEFNGVNIDFPASELGRKIDGGIVSRMFAGAENIECHGRYVDPRAGTERFSYAKMPGSGIIYAKEQHPTTKKWLLHRGTSLWTANSEGNFWTELTNRSDQVGGGKNTTFTGEYSQIGFYDKDFVVASKSGIWMTELGYDLNEFFLWNSALPVNRIMDDPSPGFTVDSGDWTDTITNDSTADWVISTAKYLPPGTPVTLTTTNTLPTNFAINTVYYVIHDPNETNTNTEIALATSHDNALNKIPLVAASTGTGTHTINGVRAYEYHYFYTFVRMIKTNGNSAAGLNRRDPNTVVLSETGIKKDYGPPHDWGKIQTVLPVSEQNPITVNLNFTENFATTDVSVANDTITTESQYDTGMVVTLTSTGVLPAGLATGTNYYVINATTGSANMIQLASSLANALAGTDIDILDVGTGTHTITVTGNKFYDDCHTHIGFYRTLNVNGMTPDGFDPISGEGNNEQVASWVGDIDIGDTTFVDKTDDLKLRAEIARSAFLAKMRGFEPLPNGNIVKVTDSWLFVAERDAPYFYYSSLSQLQKHLGGHYNPMQFHKYDQGIQGMEATEDTLLVELANQTKPVTLTSWTNKGLLEFVPVLDHFPDGDKTIGVIEWATAAEVEKSTFIAKCSDHSIRIWDGSRWGDDLSRDRINTEVRQMQPGAVGAYYRGAYYIFYRTDSTQTHNNKCYRLGLTKDAGYGWTKITGDKWIQPPLYIRPSLIQDSGNIQKLIGLDGIDNYLYWIDAFDAYNASKSYADKKIDGGFCTIGNKYWYDEMDDNSNSSDLAIGTVANGTATETSGYMRINTDQTNGDKARVIRDKNITTGDFETSVRHTSESSSAYNVKWEVKCANFSSSTDQIDVGDLTQGLMAYVTGAADGSGGYVADWRFVAGSTTLSGHVMLSARPTKLGLKRRNTNILSVLADDVEITTNSNSLWPTISGIKASFTMDNNMGSGAGGSSGFNAFNVVAGSMDSDCLGTDGQGSATVTSTKRIASLMKFMELTGRETGGIEKYQESHIKLQPVTMTSFHSAFQVGINNYIDGDTTAIESNSDVAYEGDISVWNEVEARRIQQEVTTNLSLWRMTGFDTHYWDQDKRNTVQDPASTNESEYQVSLEANLDFWMGRGAYTRDFATNAAVTLSGSPSVVVGPDGDGRGGLKFPAAGSLSITGSYTTLSGDFSLWIWVKSPTVSELLFQATGTNNLNVKFDSATVINIGGGTVTVGDVSDGSWHHIAIMRSSGAINVYHNKTLRGSLSNSTSYGGTGVIVGGDSSSVADPRLFTEVKSTDELNYYYDQVLKGGRKVLPL